MRILRQTTLFTTLIFSLLITFSACKKDDDVPGGTSTTTDTLGKINFRTFDDTLILPDVFVGISLQSTDRDNGIFLRSGITDFWGRVSFDNLDPDLTYYWSAAYGSVTQKGNILVKKSETKTVEVVF